MSEEVERVGIPLRAWHPSNHPTNLCLKNQQQLEKSRGPIILHVLKTETRIGIFFLVFLDFGGLMKLLIYVIFTSLHQSKSSLVTTYRSPYEQTINPTTP